METTTIHNTEKTLENNVPNNLQNIQSITNIEVEYLKTLNKEQLIHIIISYDKILEKFIGNLDNYLYNNTENI